MNIFNIFSEDSTQKLETEPSGIPPEGQQDFSSPITQITERTLPSPNISAQTSDTAALETVRSELTNFSRTEAEHEFTPPKTGLDIFLDTLEGIHPEDQPISDHVLDLRNQYDSARSSQERTERTRAEELRNQLNAYTSQEVVTQALQREQGEYIKRVMPRVVDNLQQIFAQYPEIGNPPVMTGARRSHEFYVQRAATLAKMLTFEPWQDGTELGEKETRYSLSLVNYCISQGIYQEGIELQSDELFTMNTNNENFTHREEAQRKYLNDVLLKESKSLGVALGRKYPYLKRINPDEHLDFWGEAANPILYQQQREQERDARLGLDTTSLS